MKRPLHLLFVSLLVVVGIGAEAVPQGESGGEQANTVDVDSERQVAPLEIPEDLQSKFEVLENPPMKLGATGDRVREVQATLNAELGGRDRPIRLGNPILIGPASGPNRDDKKSQVRIVYVPRTDMAFQIRGDWEPCINAGGERTKYSEDDDSYDLQPTEFLQLPTQPLKVDGVYGQHTQAAVMLFQLEHSLPITGEVDPVTLDKLEPMIPTNHLLAAIMGSMDIFNQEDDNYPFLVKTCTALIMTLLILIASTVVFQFARILANSTRFLSRWLFTPSSSPWFTALRNKKVFQRTAQFAPAIFIYFAARAFPYPTEEDRFPYLTTFQDWHVYVSRLGLAFMGLVFTLVAFALADACDEIFNPDRETKNPISGIIRASKRLIGLLGTVLICAAVAGKSPFIIVGGLGAFMAVIMLVFRDYLLGLAASVQIIANKVVKVGDWIAMPKYNADGDVREISLTLIKVQNFDKTVSTIPTHAVLSESFRNWTGMQSAGGRRIKRAILIDMHSIQVCTPETVERFECMELIRDYIQQKKEELEEYNREHDVEASSVNSRRLTNIGTFRAYLEAYLRHHPGLSEEMTFLVRHLQPTNNGLPIEIYAFCRETAWAKYEAVQADIFDHVLAILPAFGLRAFQEITDINPNVPEDLVSPQLQAALAEIERFIEATNRDLSDNPRSRVAARVEKVKSKIAELGLAEHIDVEASGRTITIRHLQTN